VATRSPFCGASGPIPSTNDELPDGSAETGFVDWRDYRGTAALPTFPPIGPTLAALAAPPAPIRDAVLPGVTDRNCTWI
jgi:hypothetical protein